MVRSILERLSATSAQGDKLERGVQLASKTYAPLAGVAFTTKELDVSIAGGHFRSLRFYRQIPGRGISTYLNITVLLTKRVLTCEAIQTQRTRKSALTEPKMTKIRVNYYQGSK